MSDAIASVLGLEGDLVEQVTAHAEDWEVTVRVPLPRRSSRCGGRIHGNGALPRRRVSHAWIGAKPVWLAWIPRRGRCIRCGKTVTTRPAGLERWQRMTLQAKEIALVALRRQSFRSVAQLLGVSPASLYRLVDSAVPLEDRSWWQLPGELVLSIDEHSFRGTDLVITVALCHPVRHLVAILEDDRMATLDRWFADLPADVSSRIGVVTTDLQEAYRKVVKRWCPGATVVPDPFHLVREMTAVLDEARRLEQAEARRPIPRWPLIKGTERLSPRQLGQLANIVRDYPALGALYALKEDFRNLLRQDDRETAERSLTRWLVNANACDHAEGRILANLIRRWQPNLLHHWRTARRFTNGYIEGLHTTIKLLKRLSYGFRNRHRYRRKMLLGFTPLSVIPQFLT